jgi:hypothetical protein
MSARSFRSGERVRIRGKVAVFVKEWGVEAAVVRYDRRPHDPRIVPLSRLEKLPADPTPPR